MSHGTSNPVKGGKVVSDAIMPSEYKTGKPDWQTADFKKCVILQALCQEASYTNHLLLCSSFPEDVKAKVLANWVSDGFAPL